MCIRDSHQSAAMVEQSSSRGQFVMTSVSTSSVPPRVVQRRATTESPFVRAFLIGTTFLFLGLFLILPLISIFVQAFAKGWDFYFHTLADPMAWSCLLYTSRCV